ncbi:MAG: hypothetical protein QOF20_692, partial [Acidimicrobiaceae bacterium]|nr:hypothetical protein [Acidimicrobiaceae bacterium]
MVAAAAWLTAGTAWLAQAPSAS